MICRRCGSERCIKYGTANGKQRYRRKECNRMITDTPPPGTPESMKAFAVLLHLEFGASFNSIAKYLKVSMLTVMRWVRDRAKILKKPDITPSCKIALIDEMWHFVNGKKTRYGSGRPMICYQKELLPGRLGGVTIGLRESFLKR
jgi:transposase